MKISLVFAASFFVVLRVAAQTTNVDLTPDKPYNSEPYLAVQPGQPQNVCVAWMRSNNLRVGIAVRASHDGGATWSTVTELPHFGRAWHSADVSMGWKPGGDLYLSYIDYREAPDSGGVYVTHSSDGGEHWSDPVKAIDGEANADEPIDRPWIAVDPFSKSLYPKLYLVSKPPSWNPLPNHAYFTRSMDGGQTWDTLRVLDEKPFSAATIPAPMASPTVSGDGTLQISFPCFDLSQGVNAGLALATSHDAGATFERRLTHPVAAGTTSDTAYKNGYRLVGDLSDPNHLVLGMSRSTGGNNDAYASASFDAGASWTEPARVNDDAGHAGQDMVWPCIASDGTVAVVWRDRRNGEGDSAHVATDAYYAYSRDGGTTWSKNVRVSDASAPFLPVLAGPGNDFLSAALEHDTLYAAWADTRSGALHVYFAKLGLGASAWVGETNLSSSRLASITHIGPDEVTLSLLTSRECTIHLYDVLGRELKTVGANGSMLEIRISRPRQACFLRIETAQESQLLKLQ